MLKTLHPVAGAAALLVIATFWLSTVTTELFGSAEAVAAVKGAIPWGFLLLIPALAMAGGSGNVLAKVKTAKLIKRKQRRTILAALNGIVVLVPSALFLASRAAAGDFDAAFYTVQALELVAGATNIALLTLNMLDGFRMKGRFRRKPARVTRAAT